MTLADRIVSTLSANPAPFWTLRRLHDNGGAVREALRELAEQGRVTRDDTTELYHLVSESPETPAAEAEHVEAAGMVGPWLEQADRWTRFSVPLSATAWPHVAAWAWEDSTGFRWTTQTECGTGLSSIEEAKAAADIALGLAPEPPTCRCGARTLVSGGVRSVGLCSQCEERERGSLWTTPAVPGAGGLPAAKLPGLEDEIRVLTLDDVAMPLVDAASAAAIVEAIEERSTATLPPPPPRGHPALGVGPSWSGRIAALEVRVARIDSEQAQQRNSIAAIETVGLHELAQRIARLEHPEPVGPVAQPIGDHVEALKERARIVALLRSAPTARSEENAAWARAADFIERGVR
jgi:hypothetical protein